MNSKTTKFATHERAIRRGNQEALRAWWNAACECLTEHDGNAKAYAILASKVSKDWRMNTIRQYMGELMFLIRQGHSVSEFKSLEHARETKASYNDKRETKVVSPVDKVMISVEKLTKAQQRTLLARLTKMVG